MRVLILVAAVLELLMPPQARDVARIPDGGTAVLTGTVVVDEPNGQPIRRAFITAMLNNDARQQYQTSTDDRGRFTIGGLPAGNVRLIAAKPAYVQTYYGAKQAGSTIGLPIALTSGQTVDVTIRLPRGAVIAGTVKDENGQPMAGVGVRVQRVAVSASGQRTLTSTSGMLIPSTDDRGGFRMYGLPAGDYVVSAQPRLAAGADVQPTTAADLQWADGQLRGGAGAGSNAAANAAPPAPAQTVTYASVFFPGTVNAATAGIVSLAAGQERGGIELRMQFVPTARVEGTVTTVDGQPARGLQVMLIPETETGNQDAERLAVLMEVGLLSGTTATTTADGSFSLQGVEPGAYTVVARTTFVTGRAAGAAPSAPDVSWAMTDIRVDGRDIRSLAMRLAPGQKASGRVVFDGRSALATPLRLSVTLRASTGRGFSVNPTGLTVGASGDPFAVSGLIPAPYRVTAAVPGWILKSAMLGDRDVADVPFEIKPGEDTTGLVLTFTETAAELSGVLYDGANRPTSDLSIVLFSTDRAMWFAGSRRVRPVTRPASDGRFTFAELAAGDYYLAALTDATAADLANPQFLEQVVPAAVKITIAAGEKRTQDLKIAR
jgi:hypothetical protein